VNERLHKPEFDCTKLDETYDCGCGDAPVASKTHANITDPMDLERDISQDDIAGVGLIKGGR
jgi:FAD-linked sulfhydryl oxidase